MLVKWEGGLQGEKGISKGTEAGISREAASSHSGRIRCEVAKVRGEGQGSLSLTLFQIIHETETRGTLSGKPRSLNFNVQPGANLRNCKWWSDIATLYLSRWHKRS